MAVVKLSRLPRWVMASTVGGLRPSRREHEGEFGGSAPVAAYRFFVEAGLSVPRPCHSARTSMAGLWGRHSSWSSSSPWRGREPPTRRNCKAADSPLFDPVRVCDGEGFPRPGTGIAVDMPRRPHRASCGSLALPVPYGSPAPQTHPTPGAVSRRQCAKPDSQTGRLIARLTFARGGVAADLPPAPPRPQA